MKKLLLISVVACIILSSCIEQNKNPTILPSMTPQPSSTPTSTPTKAQSDKSTPSQTITPLVFYPVKQVVFDYYIQGGHSVYDFFFEPNYFRTYSKIILYEDGQVIITGETYKQKTLSPNEVEHFLSKLEGFGFYSLESNQKHDPTDKLYDFGNNYQRSFDGMLYCIAVSTVVSKNLCVYEPDMQFLIPKMKEILQYLDDLEPTGMSLYYPDRILLWIQSGRDPYNDKLPETTIPWADHLPSLETSEQKIIYVDGNSAKEIYMLFENVYEGNVFTQNGKEYTVHLTVVLPHEKVTKNAYP